MPDNNSIIITRSNSFAQNFLRFAVSKSFFVATRSLCTWIESQELICPLQGQVVRHNKHRFLAQPQSFAFHSRSCHFKCLSGTNLVSKQGISTIEHMSDSISLVFTEGNIRIHTTKTDMTAIVFTRSGRVKKLIVLCDKCFTTARVFPNPVTESILNCLLFLLCQSRFFFIQNTLCLPSGSSMVS